MWEWVQVVLSQLHHTPNWKPPSSVTCLVSLLCVAFTQLTFFCLPMFLPASSFPSLLPLSVLLLIFVVGFGRLCKRIAGVRASALAYVFFSILFVWAVYIFVVRQVISFLPDIILNIEIATLIIGLSRISSVDPGFVTLPPSNDQFVPSSLNQVEELTKGFEVHRRIRYCRQCQKYVAGFDHHCPAFGNCIGQRNHLLFMVLLVGFIICEASFDFCASQFFRIQATAEFPILNETVTEATASSNLVSGTMLFCLIQVLWQVVFLMWHMYCACLNIKTDEWINWEKYSEFQIKVTPHAGESNTTTQFTNPYDKGILSNLKEFLTAKG